MNNFHSIFALDFRITTQEICCSAAVDDMIVGHRNIEMLLLLSHSKKLAYGKNIRLLSTKSQTNSQHTEKK